MNIYEFAKEVGLSIGTVSRAINGRKGVSASTRETVLRKMEELGFRPSRTAASLATGRTRMVALWTPGLASGYVNAILVQLECILEADDFDLAVVDVERKREDSARLLDLARWPVDGILALDAVDWLGPVARERPVPLVSFGVHAYCRGIDHVVVELGEGAEQAVEHLVAEGCRRVAMTVPSSYNIPGRARRDAYVRAVERHGFAPEFIETSSLVPAQAVQVVRDYIGAHGHPDGLFCFNDDLGIATYRGLRDLGVRVPEDVLLVGCDGVEETRYLDPPLATIEVPIHEMCATAWGFLRSRIVDPALAPRSARFSARFLPRPSAERPRV